MKVTEIFKAIQGEGIQTGKPTIFIRFSGCNLSCIWCDTSYHTAGKEMTIPEIVEEVGAFKINHATFTGGEPLVQNNVELAKLIRWLHELGIKVAIESNSIIYEDSIYFMADFISLSPKLVSSNTKTSYEAGLKSYISNDDFYLKGQLKFVVLDKEDIAEVKTILEKINPDLKVPIVFQPCTTLKETPESYKLKAAKLGEYLLEQEWLRERTWRFLLQQHVIIYGNRRGV